MENDNSQTNFKNSSNLNLQIIDLKKFDPKNCEIHIRKQNSLFCCKCGHILCQKCKKDHNCINPPKKFEDLNESLLEIFRFHTYCGRGSFGSVFKVTSLLDGTIRAIKTIENASQSNFITVQNEISIMAQLNHPNIIKYYGSHWIKEENLVYILMELADFSLQSIINKINQDEAIKYFIQICQGLKYLHFDKGIVHRDLKPGNILYNKNEDQIKLCDFGEAKVLNSNSDYSLSRSRGFGTPEYLAPEIYASIKEQKFSKNSLNFSFKSDIWSLGVIFHKLLTKNIHPYIDKVKLDDVNESLKIAFINENIDDWNSKIDLSITNPLHCHILNQCFQKDPIKRIDINEILKLILESKPEQFIGKIEPENLFEKMIDKLNKRRRNNNRFYFKEELINLEILASINFSKQQIIIKFLGLSYENGDVCPPDANKSFFYFEKAAQFGDVESIVKIARIYETGNILIEKNIEKAFQLYEIGSKARNSEAIYRLGMIYFNKEDELSKSFNLFKDAARLGHVEAVYMTGLCYFKGFGCEKNDYKAKKYLTKAAESRCIKAIETLGDLYTTNFKKDKSDYDSYIQGIHYYFDVIFFMGKLNVFSKYLEHLELKLKLNYSFSVYDFYICEQSLRNPECNGWTLYIIGCVYKEIKRCGEEGIEDGIDNLKIKSLFKKASELNCKEAMYELAIFIQENFFSQQDKEEVFLLFRRLGEINYSPSFIHLANMYRIGIGCKQNFEMAFEYYTKASQSGEKDSFYYLGYLYRCGKGCQEDNYKSLNCFRMAGYLNHIDALIELGLTLEEGVYCVKNLNEAFECFEKVVKICPFHKKGLQKLLNCYFFGRGCCKNLILYQDFKDKLEKLSRYPNYFLYEIHKKYFEKINS